MEMEDMFWEIPSVEAQEAVTWAINRLRGSKDLLWLAVHRGGIRKLDRLGKGSLGDFVNMDHAQVQRYVSFDVTRDTHVAIGPP